LQYLSTSTIEDALRERLGKLPNTLRKIYEELYEAKINELGHRESTVIKNTLTMLMVARRPLKTQEFARLISTGKVWIAPQQIASLCFDLVTIDTEQDQFRFTHLSVREFLESRHEEYNRGMLEAAATELCLNSMLSDKNRFAQLSIHEVPEDNLMEYEQRCYGSFRELVRSDNRDSCNGAHVRIAHLAVNDFCDRERQYEIGFAFSKISKQDGQEHPFEFLDAMAADYGIMYWFLHAKTANEENVSLDDLAPLKYLLCERLDLFNQWCALALLRCCGRHVPLSDDDYDYELLQDYFPSSPWYMIGEVLMSQPRALFLATACQLRCHFDVLKAELIGASTLSDRERICNRALFLAAKHGNFAAVSSLLETVVNINRIHEYSCQLRHDDFYSRVCLDTAIESDCGTALTAACANGHEAIVQMLLAHGADVNCQRPDNHEFALIIAAVGGHNGIVQALIKFGADVNARHAGKYGTPLIAAVRKGHVEIVRILLDHGADVNLRGGGTCSSAFMALGCYGHELEGSKYRATMELIVNARIDALASDKAARIRGLRSRLALACHGNDLEAAKVLDRDHATLVAFETILRWACECGDKKFVRFLLRAACEPKYCELLKQTAVKNEDSSMWNALNSMHGYCLGMQQIFTQRRAKEANKDEAKEKISDEAKV
jgi:ankyrin repeat protein